MGGFMDRVDEILNKLNNLAPQLDQIGAQVMDSVEVDRFITDLNVKQLEQGKRADGSKIDPPYRPRTRSRKMRLGLDPDKVTLHDTGAFYAGLRVRAYSTFLEVQDDDSKSEALEQKYGEAILGITDEGLVQLRTFVGPLIINLAKSIL